MAKKGRRAADRRRDESGEADFDERDDERTDLTSAAAWVGDGDGLRGGTPQLPGEELSRADIVAEAARLDFDVSDETVASSQSPLGQAQAARLIVISGVDKGRGQELIYTEMLVGRSETCDLVLRDDKVSREHLSVRYDKGRFELVDLGSSAGARVNGLRTQRAWLKHGDEIAIGDTTLRFLLHAGSRPGARPDSGQTMVEDGTIVVSAKTASRWLTRALMVGAGVVLIGGGAIGGTFCYLSQTGRVRVGLDPSLQALLEDARLAIQDGRYQQALVSAQSFLAQRPRDKEAIDIMALARRELATEEILARLRSLLAQEDFEAAQEILRGFASGTSAHARAKDLIQEADEHRRLSWLQAITRLIDDGNWDAADKLLQRHRRQYAADPAGQALERRLQELRGQQATQAVAQRRLEERRTLGPAIQAFVQGDAGEAQRLALGYAKHPEHGAAAQRLAREIQGFAASLQAAERAHRDKRAAPGLKSVAQARRHHAAITDGESSFSPRLATIEADMNYLVGVQQQRDGDPCAALKSFSRGAALAPRDLKHSAQLEKLEREAERLMVRVEQQSGRDPQAAREMAKRARCMVPPRSALARKIDAFLARTR